MDGHVESKQALLAGSVMTLHPSCCTVDTPITRVAQLMVLQDCGEIPIVRDEHSRVPIGVVTDRDIVCRLIAKGLNPLEQTAQSCMSEPAITVDEEKPIADVLALMEKHQIRRVPVVNARGECVGMISQADLAWTGSKKEVAELGPRDLAGIRGLVTLNRRAVTAAIAARSSRTAGWPHTRIEARVDPSRGVRPQPRCGRRG